GGGNDRLDASGIADTDTTDSNSFADLAALNLIGNNGDDTLIGSPYDDILNSGAGNDRVTGGTGHDTFMDSGGDDTLVERQDADIGLFGNALIIGKVVGDGAVTVLPRTHYLANQVQLISVTPGASSFQLSFNNELTVAINPATATATTVQNALLGLASVD